MSAFSIKITRFYLALFFFLLGQFIFTVQIVNEAEDGVEVVFGMLLLTVPILVLFYFVRKGKNWARWTLMALLFLWMALLIIDVLDGDTGLLIIIICHLIVVTGLFKVEKKIVEESSLPDSVPSMPVTRGLPENPPSQPRAFVLNETQYQYPLLSKRYKALFIDGMLILAIMVIVMAILDENENGSLIMISLFFILGFGYEPVLTTYSATIGQRLMKIRVRDYRNPSESINLLQAYIRVFVKGFLGWISFLTIHSNHEHRAIHDIAASSVMIDVSK